jgi:hypothetical protein
LWLDRLSGVGDDGRVTTWFRTYFEDEDVWQYFEEGADGWASRQVDVRGVDSHPLTAASLDEVLHLRDHADLVAMQRYERRFGVLAETALDGWRDAPGAQEITQAEFERLWIEARAVLGSTG